MLDILQLQSLIQTCENSLVPYFNDITSIDEYLCVQLEVDFFLNRLKAITDNDEQKIEISVRELIDTRAQLIYEEKYDFRCHQSPLNTLFIELAHQVRHENEAVCSLLFPHVKTYYPNNHLFETEFNGRFIPQQYLINKRNQWVSITQLFKLISINPAEIFNIIPGDYKFYTNRQAREILYSIGGNEGKKFLNTLLTHLRNTCNNYLLTVTRHISQVAEAADGEFKNHCEFYLTVQIEKQLQHVDANELYTRVLPVERALFLRQIDYIVHIFLKIAEQTDNESLKILLTQLLEKSQIKLPQILETNIGDYLRQDSAQTALQEQAAIQAQMQTLINGLNFSAYPSYKSEFYPYSIKLLLSINKYATPKSLDYSTYALRLISNVELFADALREIQDINLVNSLLAALKTKISTFDFYYQDINKILGIISLVPPQASYAQYIQTILLNLIRSYRVFEAYLPRHFQADIYFEALGTQIKEFSFYDNDIQKIYDIFKSLPPENNYAPYVTSILAKYFCDNFSHMYFLYRRTLHHLQLWSSDFKRELAENLVNSKTPLTILTQVIFFYPDKELINYLFLFLYEKSPHLFRDSAAVEKHVKDFRDNIWPLNNLFFYSVEVGGEPNNPIHIIQFFNGFNHDFLKSLITIFRTAMERHYQPKSLPAIQIAWAETAFPVSLYAKNELSPLGKNFSIIPISRNNVPSYHNKIPSFFSSNKQRSDVQQKKHEISGKELIVHHSSQPLQFFSLSQRKWLPLKIGPQNDERKYTVK